MINLDLFAHPRFVAAVVVTAIVGAGLYGSTYLVPLFLQLVQHMTALEAGKLMILPGLLMAVTFPIAGRLSDELPPRNLILSGLLIFGVSSLLFVNVDVNTAVVSIVFWLILGRIGLALVFPSLNATALSPLPLNLLAQGSGILNFTRQLGGAFGVISLSVFLERRTGFHVDAFTQTQSAANDQTMEMVRYVFFMSRTTTVPEAIESAGGLSVIGNLIYSQGSTFAFRDAFMMVAMVFFICLLPGLMLDRQHRTESH